MVTATYAPFGGAARNVAFVLPWTCGTEGAPTSNHADRASAAPGLPHCPGLRALLRWSCGLAPLKSLKGFVGRGGVMGLLFSWLSLLGLVAVMLLATVLTDLVMWLDRRDNDR